MRANYKTHGVPGYYKDVASSSYRNPHFSALQTALHAALNALVGRDDLGQLLGGPPNDAAADLRSECNTLRLCKAASTSEEGGSGAEPGGGDDRRTSSSSGAGGDAAAATDAPSRSTVEGKEAHLAAEDDAGAPPPSPPPSLQQQPPPTVQPAAIRVLDLACGSGEASIALHSWLTQRVGALVARGDAPPFKLLRVSGCSLVIYTAQLVRTTL